MILVMSCELALAMVIPNLEDFGLQWLNYCDALRVQVSTYEISDLEGRCEDIRTSMPNIPSSSAS